MAHLGLRMVIGSMIAERGSHAPISDGSSGESSGIPEGFPKGSARGAHAAPSRWVDHRIRLVVWIPPATGRSESKRPLFGAFVPSPSDGNEEGSPHEPAQDRRSGFTAAG